MKIEKLYRNTVECLNLKNLSYQQRAAILAYTTVVSHKVVFSTLMRTHPKSSNRDVSMT